jgi:signal transduction histidine kinase
LYLKSVPLSSAGDIREQIRLFDHRVSVAWALRSAGCMDSKPHILVVDDELGPRESLKMILNPHFTVHAAERGSQVSEFLAKFPIDLVTLDLKMPGLSGIHVLELIKQHDPEIEAIIITGYGSLDTAIEGLRLGAFDYISKPFDVNHVLSLVRRGLERRRAKAKLRQVKSDFLSNLSHELRTPLSVVVGFVHLLLNQVLGKLSDEQKKVLETVYRNSEELLELIDNVLWMTSLNAGDAGTLIDSFEMGDVVRDCVKRYQKSAEDKGLCISMEVPDFRLPLCSDRAKIERIVQNVLSNAVKFTATGEIKISVCPSADRGGVRIEISDSGVGIDPSKLATIYEPFQQLEGVGHRSGSGLGLGLAVANRMALFIGGSIDIASEQGHGTRVTMHFPSQPAQSAPVLVEERRYG